VGGLNLDAQPRPSRGFSATLLPLRSMQPRARLPRSPPTPTSPPMRLRSHWGGIHRSRSAPRGASASSGPSRRTIVECERAEDEKLEGRPSALAAIARKLQDGNLDREEEMVLLLNLTFVFFPVERRDFRRDYKY